MSYIVNFFPSPIKYNTYRARKIKPAAHTRKPIKTSNNTTAPRNKWPTHIIHLLINSMFIGEAIHPRINRYINKTYFEGLLTPKIH